VGNFREEPECRGGYVVGGRGMFYKDPLLGGVRGGYVCKERG